MMALWGAGFGGFRLMMTPAMADVIDEVVLSKKRRDNGVLLGFRAFFGRLSWAVQASSFWLIHSLTGFNTDPHSASAVFGIHVHMGLLPSILVLTGADKPLILQVSVNKQTGSKQSYLRCAFFLFFTLRALSFGITIKEKEK